MTLSEILLLLLFFYCRYIFDSEHNIFVDEDFSVNMPY